MKKSPREKGFKERLEEFRIQHEKLMDTLFEIATNGPDYFGKKEFMENWAKDRERFKQYHQDLLKKKFD
jgi:hypothetical protein